MKFKGNQMHALAAPSLPHPRRRKNDECTEEADDAEYNGYLNAGDTIDTIDTEGAQLHLKEYSIIISAFLR